MSEHPAPIKDAIYSLSNHRIVVVEGGVARLVYEPGKDCDSPFEIKSKYPHLSWQIGMTREEVDGILNLLQRNPISGELL